MFRHKCPLSVPQPVLTYCVARTLLLHINSQCVTAAQPVRPVLSITRFQVPGFTYLYPLLYVHTTVRLRHALPCLHYIPSVIKLCNASNNSVCFNILVTLIFPVHVFTFKIVTCLESFEYFHCDPC